jgi:hypothetical protein
VLNAALSFALHGCGGSEADFAETDALMDRGHVSPVENASRLAMRESANLTPQNESKINGKQKKLRFDRVAVF